MVECAAAVAPSVWPLTKNRLLILTYHRILPPHDERLLDEQPGMVVYPEALQMHLKVIKRHFALVHLSDWIARVSAGHKVPERACAVTFDDGWCDNYEHAFPLLKAQGVPATVFVVSDMVGGHQGFWPERLGAVLRAAQSSPFSVWKTREFRWLTRLAVDQQAFHRLPDPEILDTIINAAKQRFGDGDLVERVASMEQRIELNQGHTGASVLDWAQIKEMMDSGLVEIGSHTCRHSRLLPSLSDAQVEREVRESKATISRHTGTAPALFCYPNGDASPTAMREVERNYSGACSTVKGWNHSHTDRYMLRRVGLHQDISATKSAFLARISAWL